jgi:phosphoenolpyruvate-protein phosphotransferase (PTS system enzyme I)
MIRMMKGVPVSPGVAIARVYRVDEVMARQNPTVLDPAALPGEVNRFENACAAAAAELDTIIDRVAREVGEEEAAIFRAHRLLLRDPALIGKVTSTILRKGVDAGSALQTVIDEYSKLFSQIPDEYIRERLADIRDVANRVTAHLVLQDCPECFSPDEPVILAAPEILPSQAVMFERLKVAGIITETGGTTGHAAILARSLGIPAVSGLTHLLRDVRTGDLVVIDGREGVVIINPGPEVESAYRKLQREYFHLRDRLVENREQEAISTDGVRAEIMANVNNPTDAATAQHVGATGVGLYRTEYLFLSHTSVPTEQEQFDVYRKVIEAAPNKAVTIRTLDLGGDKQVPYLGTGREANPFMGWRSIRLSSDYPEFFQTQLRAILRAAVYGDVKLMFPMVSVLEEVCRLKESVRATEAALRAEGVPFRAGVPVGVMVEVPGAALCVEDLLEEVDFISIGSNDLIQYIMAADRDNPKVAHLCDPFTPAIYRLLYQLISACNARGKPVTICGEMAGRPRCFLPLFGMGLRQFSMSPAFVPTVKELVRSIDQDTAYRIAKQVLRMRATGEIKSYLTQRIHELCPNVAIFDTLQ